MNKIAMSIGLVLQKIVFILIIDDLPRTHIKIPVRKPDCQPFDTKSFRRQKQSPLVVTKLMSLQYKAEHVRLIELNNSSLEIIRFRS